MNYLCYRGRLETNAEQWLRLLHTIQDLLAWILKKQHDLKAQRPVGGDNSTLQKQMESNKVYQHYLPFSTFCYIQHRMYWRAALVLNTKANSTQGLLFYKDYFGLQGLNYLIGDWDYEPTNRGILHCFEEIQEY